MAENPKQKDMLQVAGWAVVAAVVALSVVMTAYIIRFSPEGISPSQEHWGLFGDYVGGIMNPIIAFLALIVLSIAVRLQKKELEAAGETLRNSYDIMKEQGEVLKIQSFESTFYKLAEHQFRLLEICVSKTHGLGDFDKPPTSDQMAIKNALIQCDKAVNGYKPLITAITSRKIKPYPELNEDLSSVFDGVLKSNADCWNSLIAFQPYVHHFIFMLRFLESSDMPREKKSMTFDFLRASFGSRERAILLLSLIRDCQHDLTSLKMAHRHRFFDGIQRKDLRPQYIEIANLLATGTLKPPAPLPAASPTTQATPAA